MTIKRRNKLPKRLKEMCKKLRIRITMVRNGKRVYKTKKSILNECKKKLKKKNKKKKNNLELRGHSMIYIIEMDDEIMKKKMNKIYQKIKEIQIQIKLIIT